MSEKYQYESKDVFLAKIREKYPVYNEWEDDDLYSKIIAKYPIYETQIKPNNSWWDKTKQTVTAVNKKVRDTMNKGDANLRLFSQGVHSQDEKPLSQDEKPINRGEKLREGKPQPSISSPEVKTKGTISEFIVKYAPPSENDTSNYINFVVQDLGITPDTPLIDIDTRKLAESIGLMEDSGRNPESRAMRNHNPGNLRFAKQKGATKDKDGYAVFESDEAGWQALYSQIEIDKNRNRGSQVQTPSSETPTETVENDPVEQLVQHNANRSITRHDTDRLIQLNPEQAKNILQLSKQGMSYNAIQKVIESEVNAKQNADLEKKATTPFGKAYVSVKPQKNDVIPRAYTGAYKAVKGSQTEREETPIEKRLRETPVKLDYTEEDFTRDMEIGEAETRLTKFLEKSPNIDKKVQQFEKYKAKTEKGDKLKYKGWRKDVQHTVKKQIAYEKILADAETTLDVHRDDKGGLIYHNEAEKKVITDARAVQGLAERDMAKQRTKGLYDWAEDVEYKFAVKEANKLVEDISSYQAEIEQAQNDYQKVTGQYAESQEERPERPSAISKEAVNIMAQKGILQSDEGGTFLLWDKSAGRPVMTQSEVDQWTDPKKRFNEEFHRPAHIQKTYIDEEGNLELSDEDRLDIGDYGTKEVFENAPVVGLAQEILRAERFYSIAQDPDNATEEELQSLLNYYDLMERERTRGYRVATGLTGSLWLMSSMYFTGGVYTAVKAGGKSAIKKSVTHLFKDATKNKVIKSAVKKGLLDKTGSAIGILAQSQIVGLATGSLVTRINRKTGYGNEGYAQFTDNGLKFKEFEKQADMGWTEAYIKGSLEEGAIFGIERTGGLLGLKVPKKVKGLFKGKTSPAVLSYAKKYGSRYTKRVHYGRVNHFAKKHNIPADEVWGKLRKAGYNGFGKEFGEEIQQGVLEQIFNKEDVTVPTVDELIDIGLVIAPISLFGGGALAYKKHYILRNKKKLEEIIAGKRDASEMTSKQVEDVLPFYSQEELTEMGFYDSPLAFKDKALNDKFYLNADEKHEKFITDEIQLFANSTPQERLDILEGNMGKDNVTLSDFAIAFGIEIDEENKTLTESVSFGKISKLNEGFYQTELYQAFETTYKDWKNGSEVNINLDSFSLRGKEKERVEVISGVFANQQELDITLKYLHKTSAELSSVIRLIKQELDYAKEITNNSDEIEEIEADLENAMGIKATVVDNVNLIMGQFPQGAMPDIRRDELNIFKNEAMKNVEEGLPIKALDDGVGETPKKDPKVSLEETENIPKNTTVGGTTIYTDENGKDFTEHELPNPSFTQLKNKDVILTESATIGTQEIQPKEKQEEPTAVEISPKKITGYRSKSIASLNGERRIDKVVEFETGELENTDIPETLIAQGVIKDITELGGYIEGLKEKGFTEVIWLTDTEADLKESYGKDITDAERFDIEEGIVISDLGTEGKLVAYKPVEQKPTTEQPKAEEDQVKPETGEKEYEELKAEFTSDPERLRPDLSFLPKPIANLLKQIKAGEASFVFAKENVKDHGGNLKKFFWAVNRVVNKDRDHQHYKRILDKQGFDVDLVKTADGRTITFKNGLVINAEFSDFKGAIDVSQLTLHTGEYWIKKRISEGKPRKIKGWVKNEVKAKSVLSAVQYYNENKEWVQKTGESKGDFIARESKIPKSMSITTAVDYIKKYFPEIKQSKVKIRESLKELKSKGTGKMGYQSSGAYRATGESGYGSISYSKYATDDIDEWIYDNLPQKGAETVKQPYEVGQQLLNKNNLSEKAFFNKIKVINGEQTVLVEYIFNDGGKKGEDIRYVPLKKFEQQYEAVTESKRKKLLTDYNKLNNKENEVLLGENTTQKEFVEKDKEKLYEIASIKPRKIKGWVKNEVKAKSVLSAVQYYNENKEWVQKTGESKGDFIARESKIPKSMSITTAVDYIKKYFPEIKQSKVKIRESLKELKSKGTGKMGYQSSGAYRATGESGYGSISYSKYATDDIDEWIYDNLPPESKGMSKSKIKAHARRTKSGKVVMVKEHQDSRTKKNSFLDLLLNYDDTEDLKNGESLKKRVKARLKVLKVQRRKLHDEYKKWESKTYKQTKAGMTPGEAREDIHGSARFYTYTQLNEKRKQRRLQAIESKIKTIDNWIDKYSHDLKNTEKYHWSNQYGEYDIPKNTATHTDRNPKNWMNKSRIKQHMRRTKSGKIVVVKEHTDSRTKKEKPAPKPDTDLFGNPIPETNKPPKSEVKELRIQDIEPDPDQPRKEFSEEKLKTLADSIKKIGLIQDIAVRPHPTKQGKYIVIAGERRYRAHKIAGLTHARTRIYDLVDPKDIFAIQVAENVGRKDMNPIETATAFKKLYDVGMPIDEIAKKVSAKAVTVERKMKLLDLIPGLQKHIKDGHVSIHQGWMISNAKLTPEFQHNIMMRLNAGKITNEALSGMIGKYKSAMSQTDIFQVQDAQNTGLGRLNKNTVRTLEMQSDKLIKDVVKLLKQIDEKGGSKINPAIAKEKGKLNLYCDKIDILTEQFTKLKKEADRAKAYFKEGGSVSEYLDSSKVKGNKKWVFVNGKRVLKSMLKAIKGHRGGGHKYIKRLGTKLNYRYVYQNKKVEHADVLLHPHPTDKNRVDVKFDYEWGSQEWTNLKNKIKDIGGYDRKSYDPRRKVWSIKRQDLDELIDKVGTIAVSKDGQLVIHSKDVQADTNTKKKKKKATSQDKAGSRGSVDWWIDIKGKVRYDKKPKGAKEITREEFEKEGIGSRWTLGWLDEKIAEGDKRMADYYARDIEKEAKRILENREAEAGSGALKASTLSKDEKDTTQDDYHAILQYMFSKGYLRVATRGAYKGKMCIDWKVANPDTHRADTKADKLARRLISDIKKWDSPLAPPKLPHFNQDHYKINIVNMITDYNKGEGTTIVNAIFSGDKSKSKKVYDQADKIKDKSKKLDKHMAKAVKAFDSSKEVSISSMKKSVSLWKHQNKYLNWMLTVGKGVIGADTGLGKTLISLSYIKKMKEDKKIDGGLAFLPGSVMYGWQPDLNTFFKGKGKVLYIDGTQKQKMEQIKSIGKKKYDLIVASHGLLQSGGKLLTELMKRTKKHAIFYDESHKGLLNPRNKTYKNFKSKIKQKFVFLLSATPARNEPLDIVHQINLLYDGALGDTKTFHSQYYEQVHNGNSKQWIPNASKMKEMWSRVKPFVPVVNKYSTDIKLPKRVDNTDILSMPKDQDRYYEASAQAFLNAILAVDNPKAMKKSESTHILSTLGAMRRTAFDPRMENPTYTGGSAIFDRASEIIGERLANGKLGTVVASTFVKPFPAYVKMIKEQHGLSDSQIGVITGRTKPKERQAIQNKMNSGKLKLILMGIASGGAGMNLQKGADTLLVMSDPWTYADKKQAVDRIIRPGATSETVFINDFNIQGSITDFVRQKIAMKQQMHSESDHEGAIQENMGKLTFDDYLKIAGITEKEYKRKKKMKKSLKLPQYIHMRKST